MRLRPQGFFLARTALLPVEVLEDGVGAALERVRLDPLALEALWWSSPSLAAEALANARHEAVITSLARYVQRFAGRATPRGLTASVSLGRIAETPSRLEAGPPQKRISASMVAAWTLATDAASRQVQQQWGPAPSLHVVGTVGSYCVWAAAGDRLDEVRRTVELTPHVQAVLVGARSGASRGELVEALRSFDAELAVAEAGDFVDQVISEGLLIPHSVPLLTDAEPLHRLGDDPQARQLSASVREVAAASGVVELERLTTSAPGAHHAFDVALVRPPLPVLSTRTADELAKTFGRILEALTPDPDPRLAAFARAFTERYEDAEVPLLVALDPLRGLEPPTAPVPPVLAGVPFADATEGAGSEPVAAWLLDGVMTALRDGAEELVLEAGRLPTSDVHATTATALFQVQCPPDGGPDDQRARFVLKSGAGTCNLRTFGRFSVVLPELVAPLRALAQEESRLEPGVVFAEVLYQPPDPGLPLCRRAPLRTAAIPVNTRASPDDFAQILSPAELLVSVRGGRVLLRSASTGSEVRPRIASAYRADNPQVSRVYALLEALAHQDTLTVSLPLGPLAEAPYLPRIRLGRVVLQPARWRLSRAFQTTLRKTPAERRATLVREEGRRRGWPRLTTVREDGSDQSLRLDLEDELSVAAAVKVLGSERAVTVAELSTPGLRPGAVSAGGHHVVEVQLPLVDDRAPAPLVGARRAEGPVRRRFPPRSEWRTLKLYGASQTLEEVLSTEVLPHVVEAPWFYLFYADPRTHLRLRFSRDAMKVDELLERLRERVDVGLLSKVEETTYVREVERYGGPRGIVLAETVFWADSVAAANALPVVEPATRWLALLGTIDDLWRTLGHELPARLELARRQARAYATEFRAGPTLNEAASRIARARRSEVEALLAGTSPLAAALRPALASRATRLASVLEGLASLPARDEVSLSFAHMSATRWLAHHVRHSEWLLYQLLERALHSQLARR